MQIVGTILLLAQLLGGPGPKETPGTVTGQVIDHEGRPTPNVIVKAFPEGPHSGPLPDARTDGSGNFVLRRLNPGGYRLFTAHTEAGYPDTMNGLFTGDPSMYQDVRIEPGGAVSGVTLTLPEKGARFTLVIVDDETGAPVLASRVQITRADLDQDWPKLDSSPTIRGVFSIVLTNSPFLVQVRAGGYQSWSYTDVDIQGKETHRLVLAPGTSKEITVKLRKVKPAESAAGKQ
jgi:hypothetical protein